jgi:hypothetical protein
VRDTAGSSCLLEEALSSTDGVGTEQCMNLWTLCMILSSLVSSVRSIPGQSWRMKRAFSVTSSARGGDLMPTRTEAMGVPSAEEMVGKVIVLAGPTAVGKSSVAKELCRLLDAEIVIADSVQVVHMPLCMSLYV